MAWRKVAPRFSRVRGLVVAAKLVQRSTPSGYSKDGGMTPTTV